MSEWNEIRFSEIATVIMGQSPASEFYNNDGNGLPFMQGNRTFGDRYPTIDTYTTQITKKVSKGSILMSVRAPVGDINIAPLEMCIGRGLCAITAKDGNNEFVRYLLNYNMPKLKSSENGTTFTAINGDNIKNLKILVPDLPTQKRIAEILSAYDDLIENNNRRIALLEKAAQELYKEWFVRFRFPGHENVKSENGMPEGWEYIRFGNAIEIIDGDRGVNYPKQEEFYEEGECLFLNAGNVAKNGFDFSSCAYITKEKDQLLRKGKLQTGDVVLTTRGTVGNVAFLNETMTFSPMRINSGMVILRNLGVVSPEYIYTALRHESLQKAMMMYASGSAQPQLPIKDMRRIKIIKADAKTMDKFTKYVADIYKQVSLMIIKNQAISKQRDLLLPRLMSGKLEV